ncbi:hypothetical protein QWI17_18930 [Gilvimarinus sp. SDUM040013]|uniref:Uncharacterized protein n=1 Tax=Gilvimarinus gilvus TaxID=3058038 RepID=A0ABU4RWY2_9GAMM|nr:hypothetical protein [Gilvimarinus sp. SDUM040013]MDO3387927.1 hypothetical protein [Gilvimarinus sp. SDUM040013]MDX6848702.1 hypothetical protein [Gilvimarinus sp. SDUM040013]
MQKNVWLIVGGGSTLVASLLHIAIIVGGAEWYRFFGAGEQMAQMAEQGSSYPAQITGVIALVLFSWALYAFSGAGLVPRMPFARIAMVLIATVFMLRGLFGIPAVLYFDTPYFQELGHSLTFMLVSSGICLVLGICYAVGTWQVWPSLKKKGGSDIPVY